MESPVIRVAGDLDADAVERLAADIASAGPSAVVDLTHVGYLEPPALAVLGRAASVIVPRGSNLARLLALARIEATHPGAACAEPFRARTRAATAAHR